MELAKANIELLMEETQSLTFPYKIGDSYMFLLKSFTLEV